MRALVVTTGTFLNGLVHIGPEQRPSGRAGEPPSCELAESLKSFGFEHGRLKTGTPPRLDRASIDFDGAVAAGLFSVERGDDPPVPFSFLTSRIDRPQIDCYLLHTNDRVRDLVRANLDRSPLFNGQIRGIGPRYCPSLEDKIVRFPDTERHQIFLEPEGVDAREIYVNGFSMSLPRDVQADLVHALPGLERRRAASSGVRGGVRLHSADRAHAIASKPSASPGCFSPGRSTARRATRRPRRRELLPALMRSAFVRAESRLELQRDEAYIGILVDDLITKGCLEPYRMFTSRAEHRLLLRIDNADLRLTARGREFGLVDDERWVRFCDRRGRLERNLRTLEQTMVREDSGARVPANVLLRRPDVTLRKLHDARAVTLDVSDEDEHLDFASAETTIKYVGYLRRETAEIARARKEERRRIPSDFPFDRVPGLSREVVQRLFQVRPDTLGQALRIPGVTPAAIAVLSAFVGRSAGASE